MTNAATLNVTTPTDREIVITRLFDAPRELVWQAYTEPELIKRWLMGPPGWSFAACEVDLRVGGAYRYVWNGPDGVVMSMAGVYREIVAPERLVTTETFEASWYPGEALDTLALIEQAAKTTITMTILYESREARDTALQSGMEQGLAAGFNRLEEVLAATK